MSRSPPRKITIPADIYRTILAANVMGTVGSPEGGGVGRNGEQQCYQFTHWTCETGAHTAVRESGFFLKNMHCFLTQTHNNDLMWSNIDYDNQPTYLQPRSNCPKDKFDLEVVENSHFQQYLKERREKRGGRTEEKWGERRGGRRKEGEERREKGGGRREEGEGRRERRGGRREEGEGRREKGGGRRDEGEGRREKGGGRGEEGEGRREKGGGRREERERERKEEKR